jgi:hypothetical protein
MLQSSTPPTLSQLKAHSSDFFNQLGIDLLVLEKAGCTSGCQNSWRKAAFQYTITYGTFVKRRATTFQIVPQVRDYLKKQNGS